MDEKRNAVVVPILASDLTTVREVLRFWAEVNPPFAGGPNTVDMDLVYVLPGDEAPAVEEEINGIARTCGAGNLFTEVVIEFCGVPESFDYYIRNPRGLPPTEEGFVAGPNRVFFHLAECIGPRYEWCFLMELDCLPLRAGWGDAVRREMARFSDAWVVGSRYHGWSWLGPELDQHLNGNALYRFGDDAFQAFLKEVWIPGTQELLSWGYPGLAFDCFPSILSALATGPLVSGEIRARANRANGRFVESSMMLNLSGSEDERSRFGSVDSLLEANPETFLFHAAWLMEDFGLLPSRPAESAVTESPSRDSTLDYCVKSIFAAKGAWVFGGRFAFRAKESAIVMQVVFDKTKVSSVRVEGGGNGSLRFIAKRWSEKRSGGTGVVKFLASVLSIFGLRKRHGLSMRDYLASWCLRLSSASRTDIIGALRIWLRELRGRKVASGRGGIEIDLERLGKASGITLIIRSETEELVEGRIRIDVERRD